MKRIIINRLREPSTWAGLAAIGVMFGIDPAKVDIVHQAVVGVAGLVAMCLPERKA